MCKDRNIEKFKVFIYILYTSIQIGILDSCLSDSYFCFFNFFSFGRIRKGRQDKLQNFKLIFICSIYTRIKEHTTKTSVPFLTQAFLYLFLKTVLFVALRAFSRVYQRPNFYVLKNKKLLL